MPKLSSWLPRAAAVTIVVNVVLIGLVALLISERGLPEVRAEGGAIQLANYEPPEPPKQEEAKEPEKPKPQPKLDFTPELVQPQLAAVTGPDFGVSVDLGGIGASGAGEKFVFEAFELDEQPRPIAKVPPVYPYKAREQGIEGIVQIKMLINIDGTIGDLIIIDARPRNLFEEAVLKTVPRWKFSPGKIEGKPVTAWVVTTVRFELN